MAQKLIKLRGNTYYIDSAVNIGVVSNDRSEAIIIDTGIDDDMGRKILRFLREEGLTPVAIINTHSHADHCGGNNFITKRFDIPIYATSFEKAVIENPLLEPFYLYSAYPLKEMQNKFLMAKESEAEGILKEGETEIEGIPLQIISLKGHSPGMIGIATEDNVLFTGDAFFPKRILDKYALSFYTDIKNTLDTLKYLKTLEYNFYVPGHGEVLEDINPTVDTNITQINEIVTIITELCSEAKSREDVASYIINHYNIKLNVTQYYLTLSTIAAYLSYLTDDGTLKINIEDNNIKWVKV